LTTFENFRSGGQKGRGLGEKEFLPALAFVASFFATAIFRASFAGTSQKIID